MAEAAPAHTRLRLMLVIILAVSAIVFVLQLALVRPRLWPAGPGLTLSGDSVLVGLGAPSAIPRMRPPDALAAPEPVQITGIMPGGPATQAALGAGSRVTAIRSPGGSTIDLDQGLPADAAELLMRWRDAYWLGPLDTIALSVDAAGTTREVTLPRRAFWDADQDTIGAWLRTHGGALLHTAAFLGGAIALVALGTSGMTAVLMTLALVVTAVANAGLLLGAERYVPLGREILVMVSWLATPLAFPVIGLAVLYFPTRAAVLDRHRWIVPALAAAAAPMFIISLLAALFLLGLNGALPALAWVSSHGWSFQASFAVALAANVLIVVEGIGRYRSNPDQNERRRIQLIVFTGVPAVFAYAIRVGVPMLSSAAGRPIELPWLAESFLQAVVLLPAFGLPYAVAFTRVFSPRTVLRQSLQYALARRTLSILIVLPIAAFAVAIIMDRNRSISEILLGQPLFYIVCVALAVLGRRYRDVAQRWLDRRFFRPEYDAREILVSLASRVPYESDPRELVATVLTEIDAALHPDSAAVVAGDADDQLDVISALRTSVDPLARTHALVTLLRWSDAALDVSLEDDRSAAARLPPADRAWLEKTRAVLLVPIFAGAGDARVLTGIVVLGEKRSEEPYTAEDRRLLSGIAAQMSVALDLSRLRKLSSVRAARSSAIEEQAAPTIVRSPALTPSMLGESSPTVLAAIAACPACRRCFELETLDALRCPDDESELQPVMGMPAVVDGKYRVDAIVGRGGMGAVFRARDVRLDRDVAIKVVRADLVSDQDSRARFQREAQIVARLQHPAIVTVFDYGNLSTGAAFLVMELVRGEDLRDLLKREGALSHARAIELMAAVALGVDAAHRAGVLHRDLKPDNVLLPANGIGPKVLDFGLAKFTDGAAGAPTVTQGVAIVGTPAYMAPEQLRGETLDARADIFSLGVMTYELLTGELPFGSGSFVEIGIKQAKGPASIDMREIAPSLATVLRRALALNRDDRQQSAAMFAEELRTAQS